MTGIVRWLRVASVSLITAILAVGAVATAQDVDCGGLGRQVFAELDYYSSHVHNAIVPHILVTGYGYTSESIPGSTVPITPDEGARYFLETRPEAWSQWVPADIAARVGASLQ